MFGRPVQLLVGALVAGVIGALLLGPAEPVAVNVATIAHKAESGQVRQSFVPPKPVLATTPAAKAALVQQAALRLIVGYKHGVSATASVEAEAGLGLHLLKTIPSLDVRVVTVSSSDKVGSAMAILKGRSDVQFVERDAVVAPQDNLPNDPSFPAPSYAIGGGAWGWTMTHTTQAWDITTGSPGVVIAILDTGIRTTGLADFNGQIVSTWNTCSSCSANNTTDVTTNAGVHGTYVAGVAGLAIENGLGNSGFCPGCKLMIVQVGTDGGAYLSDIASGLTWAADHGAQVANMSWAATTDYTTLTSATTYAHGKGVVMTAAAGNSNCNCITYPSADPYVLGVAGLDNAGNKQGDSNYGSWVALAAPEGNMTAWPAINGCNGCPNYPGYAPVGGTSSAAPVVAGIAGLLFSAKAGISNTQVEQALESSATPANFTVKYGKVDALAAMSALGLADSLPSSLPVNVAAPQIFVETNGDWNYIPLTGSPQVGQVLLRGQGGWTGSAPLSLAKVTWQRCDSSGANCTVIATAAKYTVQSTDAGYSFYVSVAISNSVGSTTVLSSLSAAVAGTLSPTSSPSPSPSPSPTASPSTSPSPAVSSTFTQTFSSSLNSKNPSRQFTIAVGSGAAGAQLSFSRCNSLMLVLATSSGLSVAASSGPSVVSLNATLAAGSYTLTVSGGRCSFTLTVTATSP
jgi:thermitase